MRVIVTGGSGVIGSALVTILAKEGHEVIVLTRSSKKNTGKLPQGVKLEKWDARSAQGWGPLADGASAIVNLAGERIAPSRWTDAKKKKIMESRLNAGHAIMEAIQQATVKPGVVIQSSAVGYYGPRGDEVVTEDTPPGKDFQSRVCIAWEQSTAPVEAMGVRRAILRSSVVLTRQGGVLPIMSLPVKFFVGGPIGNGKQWFPWVHIADVVDAIRFLIQKQTASGAFNLSAPNPLTNRQFTKTLGRVLGRPIWLPVPGFAMKLVFGEMSTFLLDGQRELPKRLEEAGYNFHFPQAEAALRDLFNK